MSPRRYIAKWKILEKMIWYVTLDEPGFDGQRCNGFANL